MNLHTYINQENPIRGLSVTLTEKEYVIGTTRSYLFNDKISSVFISLFPGIEYCVINKRGNLYTTDRDGNILNKSCFKI